MRRRAYIAAFALSLGMTAAHAMGERNPLDAPRREWGAVLGLSLLGGVASWINRVRTGLLRDASPMSLVGESVIAGFAGVLSYLLCLWLDVGPAPTYFCAGLAGHMGAEAIKLAERAARRRAEVFIETRAESQEG
jgi:hypothetical protein